MTYPPSGAALAGARAGSCRAAPVTVPRAAPRCPGRRPSERLRAAATTEPGRLQIIGAVLALLVVVFGAVTVWQVSDRASAADDVVSRSQPLSADAASIYRSLADADTTAASGFLAGGAGAQGRARAVRRRTSRRPPRLLVKAAASTDGLDGSVAPGDHHPGSEQLPEYTGLIERARANNRQGLPLGGAYLRYANEQMRTSCCPPAERLYAAETDRLDDRLRRRRGAGRSLALAAGRRGAGGPGVGAAAQLPPDQPGLQPRAAGGDGRGRWWCCCGWWWAAHGGPVGTATSRDGARAASPSRSSTRRGSTRSRRGPTRT